MNLLYFFTLSVDKLSQKNTTAKPTPVCIQKICVLPNQPQYMLFYLPPWVTYGVRSPKFICAPCAQLYLLAETSQLPPSPPHIWAHIRKRYWSAKIATSLCDPLPPSVCCFTFLSLLFSLLVFCLPVPRQSAVYLPQSAVFLPPSAPLYAVYLPLCAIQFLRPLTNSMLFNFHSLLLCMLSTFHSLCYSIASVH